MFVKTQYADERIATMKPELRNKFKIGDNWIQNTMKWLTKKAKDKSKLKKTTLKWKFEKLDEEKKILEQVFEANVNNETKGNNSSPLKTVVYNNSSKVLSPKQQRILELGLNFAITPKKFPLLEYIVQQKAYASLWKNMVMTNQRRKPK